MTCVSSRRPVSDHLTWLLILMVGWLAVWPGEGKAAAKTGDPDLVLAPGVQASARMEDWLQEDRSWLGQLPSAERINLPQTIPSATADSVAQVTRWILAQAQGDTLPAVRPVTSRLRDRWLDRGFLAANVAFRVSAGDSRLELDPGPRFTVAEMVVNGADFEGRDHLLRLWLPEAGVHFDPPQLARGIEEVLIGAGESGFPFARWVTSEVSISLETATVRIQATLLPGRLSYIGPVTSDLPEGRPADFLSRASGLRSGDVFRQSDVQRSVQRLLAKDLYASVGLPSVYPTTSVDTVGVHYPVVARRKVNRLQVVLGLSRRQESEPSRLSGEVDLRLPNMAGSGRNLAVNWRNDGRGTSHFGLGYLEPMAFGTPLDMILALDSEVDTDVYTRFRLDNRWQLPVVALWGVELGIGWDRSTYPVGTLEHTSRVRARGAFLHRRGDTSRSGWAGAFAIESAWRSSTLRLLGDDGMPVLGSSQLGEALTQRIYEVDTSGEVWLGRTWSLAGRAAFRQISGGEDVIPLSEQFRFGGAATLRGYQEDEFHGSEAAYGGVELRIGPPEGSRLYTFYDLGYFGFSTLASDPGGEEIKLWKNGWPRGYGLGILARTPGGDISLAVGFPGTVDFDQAKLHVTLLESF